MDSRLHPTKDHLDPGMDAFDDEHEEDDLFLPPHDLKDPFEHLDPSHYHLVTNFGVLLAVQYLFLVRLHLLSGERSSFCEVSVIRFVENR